MPAVESAVLYGCLTVAQEVSKGLLVLLPILQQVVQRSDEIFPHLHRLELYGRESTEAATVEAKWFSGSLDTVELHRSFPFSFQVKRSSSLASSMAWERCFSSSLLSTCIRASAGSVLLATTGCEQFPSFLPYRKDKKQHDELLTEQA